MGLYKVIRRHTGKYGSGGNVGEMHKAACLMPMRGRGGGRKDIISYMETVKFDELQLDERIIRAITEMGFEEASPIQAQAIPVAMEGRDMIGQAQTGTGKTAAFGIPLLQKVDPKVKKLQAIILLPTRELAIQVAEEMRRLAKFMHGTKVLPIYGGQDIVKQIRSLKDGTQIVVGPRDV